MKQALSGSQLRREEEIKVKIFRDDVRNYADLFNHFFAIKVRILLIV